MVSESYPDSTAPCSLTYKVPKNLGSQENKLEKFEKIHKTLPQSRNERNISS